MKIAILGYSGSGKSTLAKRLGALLDVPVLYLDTVQFEPGWKERDRAEARALVAGFMTQPAWVIDGNYTGFYQQERLEQADAIIHLRFNRIICLWRICKRYAQYRHATRESMAPGCPEKLDAEFVWWILYNGRSPEQLRHHRAVLNAYRRKSVVIRNQKQLDRFLADPFAYLGCEAGKP